MKKKHLLLGGLGLLAISLIMGAMDHGHGGDGIMSMPGFLFLFGIIGGALLTVFAKIIMYKLIGRKDDYYGKGDWD
ncbi:MAG: hypothetical protein ABIJ96_04560 [Elusimicrobiota bacterium]